MSARVLLFDDTCSALRQPLDIAAEDSRGIVLQSAVASALGHEWGADLSWSSPIPRPNVYRVLVDDPTAHFAPFRSGDLNGNQRSNVNAIIYPLPTSGGGGGSTLPPTAPLSAVGSFVKSRPQWSEPEQEGVIMLIEVYIHYSAFSQVDWVASKLASWRRPLATCGVLKALTHHVALRSARAAERGGGMVMG